MEISAGGVDDRDAIFSIHAQAFEREDEAWLTLELLSDETALPVVSLVARSNGQAIGHVLFTRVCIDGVPDPLAHILAPLAIAPPLQRQGIGSKLIQAGKVTLKEMGSQIIFVLGDPDYYSRAGFQPDAGATGFAAPYSIPDKYRDAWMFEPLTESPHGLPRGRITCARALDRAEYWRE